jgi:Lon protease-like protein
MPSRLPIFPLDLVLFPGELLPLHIFEPRYRQLLADCLEGDRRFGITAVTSPAAGTIGCIAVIRATEPLPDGRSNIVVAGERRFGIRTLLDEGTPYLVASVEPFSDQSDTAPLPVELDELRRLGGELALGLGLIADRPGEPPAWDEDSETVSFQVAAIAAGDVESREPLLALRSTRDRARALLALLPGLVAGVRSRAEVHVRARSNGKGHHASDVAFE